MSHPSSLSGDYYELLGVESSADLEAIRQAYRRLAVQHHPDRGGSHEAMVKINEAWNVLSNPATREEYDRIRSAGGTAASYHSPGAEKARAEAADYAASWSEFDSWWNGMGADFHRTEFKGGGAWGWGAKAETTSGMAFILAGIALTWILAPENTGWFRGPFRLFLIAVVGSWLGALAHKITRLLFFDAPSPAAATATNEVSFSTATHRARTNRPIADPTVVAGVAKEEVSCPECGQALRVPTMEQAIRVTCKSCNHVFRKEPS